MKTLKILVAVVAAMLVATQAAAQGAEADEARRSADQRNEEARMLEAEAREAEAREKMREAERQLAEAARQIAELSSQNLPRVVEMEKSVVALMGKPRLGVTIGSSDDDKGPVEGARIVGVSPGSAADDAGLRAYDIITSINGESLSAATSGEANRKLLDFMQGVEEGDKLKIEYLRDGNVGSVEVEPRVIEGQAFAWSGDGGNIVMPPMHAAPQDVRRFQFVMPFASGGWGDMELVELNAGLGRYFGTDTGLLVVSAPKSDAFKLQDGDVIQSIDGREPKSVGHAMRILSSYQPGESLELRIMRDKRRQTLNIEMPDDRTSQRAPTAPEAVRPARIVPPPPAPLPERRT